MDKCEHSLHRSHIDHFDIAVSVKAVRHLLALFYLTTLALTQQSCTHKHVPRRQSEGMKRTRELVLSPSAACTNARALECVPDSTITWKRAVSRSCSAKNCSANTNLCRESRQKWPQNHPIHRTSSSAVPVTTMRSWSSGSPQPCISCTGGCQGCFAAIAFSACVELQMTPSCTTVTLCNAARDTPP